MSLSKEAILALADKCEQAQLGAKTMTMLTLEHPGMTIDDGYAVQDELRRRSVARGARIVGFKAGLTSKAKMLQMGVSSPSVGFLTSDGFRPEGSAISMDDLIHPRVEAEVAFKTKKELRGADCSVEQVIEATDFVVPAVEVIDSRFEKFKFDLPSVIADNTSAARYVSGGRPRDPRDIDLTTLGVVIERNGEVAALGASAAVLGNPAEAVAMVVKHLHSRGESLAAGSFVMSGGITEAIFVHKGDNVLCRIQELGSLSMRFV